MVITNTVDYVRWTQTTALYLDKVKDEDEAMQYEILGVLDEVGEIASMLKRQIRDDVPFDREKFGLELGDLAWYLARIHYNHADAELDKENNIYPIVEELGFVDKIKGLTCFDIVILVAEHLKPHYMTKEAVAKFIFGKAPSTGLQAIKQIQDGLMSVSDNTIQHFVFAIYKRLAESPTVGILMHAAREAHSMEAVLDFCSLCYKYNYDILDVLQNNVIKLESRKERGVLHGKGSER